MLGPFLKIFKNAGFLTFSRILQPLFSFALIIVIARYQGAHLLGGFDIILSFLAVFQTIASFGLKYLITREVARNQTLAGAYFVHACLLALPVGLGCALLMYCTSVFLGYERILQLSLAVGGFVLVATTLIDHCEGIYLGLEHLKPYAIISAAENIVRVGLSIYLVQDGYGLLALMVVMSCTRSMAFLGNIFYLKRLISSFTFKIDTVFFSQLIAAARTFAGILILSAIYGRMDILVLSQLRNTQEVGLYSAAFRFIGSGPIIGD